MAVASQTLAGACDVGSSRLRQRLVISCMDVRLSGSGTNLGGPDMNANELEEQFLCDSDRRYVLIQRTKGRAPLGRIFASDASASIRTIS